MSLEKILLEKEKRIELPKNYHLVAEYHEVSGKHPLHWHSYFEIEIILSGNGKYIINDTEYDIAEQNIFFLTSTDFHYMVSEGVTELINISFDEEMIEDKMLSLMLSSKTDKAYSFGTAEYERVVSGAKLLIDEYNLKGDCERQLLHYILSSVFRKSVGAKDGSDSSLSHYKGIKKAVTYIEMHFKENITLDFLASEAGYNKTYFSELFRKITGETYIDKVNRLRIGYARTLLANGFSVSDASALSGFGSLSNFLAIFKKKCGVTPSEYKKRAGINGKVEEV